MLCNCSYLNSGVTNHDLGLSPDIHLLTSPPFQRTSPLLGFFIQPGSTLFFFPALYSPPKKKHSKQVHKLYQTPNWYFFIVSFPEGTSSLMSPLLLGRFGMFHFCLGQVLSKFTARQYSLQLSSKRLHPDYSEILVLGTPLPSHPPAYMLLFSTCQGPQLLGT